MSISTSNPVYTPTTSAFGDSNDDFVVLEDLPMRPKEPENGSSPRVEVNNLATDHSFLISIHPPARPSNDIKHVPCDIVLVIDVSGSMAELAPLPDAEDEEESEESGLTVLDLVRHACKTIISTLNEDDRLALVTFSEQAKLIQPLTNMTESAKAETLEKVSRLKDEGATNLWGGIRTGLLEFEHNPPIGNVQGLYVLTDGQPNYMCPQQGYVPKLKPLLDGLAEKNGSTPTIQTFGFGYSIRSDLMLSIAKAGNGNYAFIPEVGMIGTVFVHAVANLYATYATNAVLEVNASSREEVHMYHNSGLPTSRSTSNKLIINLGNIQYGQSRDLVINHHPSWSSSLRPLSAKLSYTSRSNPREAISIVSSVNQASRSPTLPPSILEYHYLRNELCKILSNLYPIDTARNQHITAPATIINGIKTEIQTLVTQLMSVPDHNNDPNISALLSDLIGPQLNSQTPEQGQIWQALSTESRGSDGRVFKSYWQKWGRHYLSSLWCAHMRQTCNSFKDAGPLRYGTESDLFKRCRDELDQAFDSLPAPVGTYHDRGQGSAYIAQGSAVRSAHASYSGMQIPDFSQRKSKANVLTRSAAPVKMRRYNCRDNTCFLGSCPVTLANGQSFTVRDLRPGMTISNPLDQSNTKRGIVAIIKSTPGTEQQICRIAPECWITPWHPIYSSTAQRWAFPNYIATETRTLNADEAVYSVVLSPDSNPESHAIEIGGVPCVTLGHGITSDPVDVRAHAFFGNYRRVVRGLAGLSTDEHGRYLCGGLIRDVETELVVGVLGASFAEGFDSGVVDDTAHKKTGKGESMCVARL